MKFGVAYYPEHWPKEMWEKDAEFMREAHINLVRLAEFGWAKLEPEKGCYDFSWLDEAIELLSRYSIQVVLGTPTATPPKWFMDRHPEVYPKDRYGITRGFGSRRHYCFNNPAFQEATREIVAKVAEHYGDHSSVVAWQVDNEFGCQETTYCYCESCLQAFRHWLQKKYGTIDALNHAWGTIFWSQTYRDWDEIILPAYSVCSGADPINHGHNPSLTLDYKRFASDSVVAYQKLQIDTIRNFSAKPITHNLMGHFPEIDYFDLAKDLDFVSWDNYPEFPKRSFSYLDAAMAHDLMRGTKGKNFWVMEQQSGPCGWNVLSDTPKPGQLRLWSYQAVAHGAEAILYFRFRACRFGTEQYWYGILDHDSVPRRRYKEIQQTGAELKALSDWIVGSKVMAETAMIKSYDNLWSHQIQPHNVHFDYQKLLLKYYSTLAENHLPVDVISIDDDLAKYKLLLLPAFNLMNSEIKVKLDRYVKSGGTLVLTFRSGTRNWDNTMSALTIPGEFSEMAGIEVEEFDSLNRGRQVSVATVVGSAMASIWCDIIKPTSARVIGDYTSDYYKGEPAITVNDWGNGKVYYIGCDLDPSALDGLMRYISDNSGVSPLLARPVRGVELIRKENGGRQFLMALNHNSHEVVLDLKGDYTDLLTKREVHSNFVLPPFGVGILV
ncbi:beta-galactosidase [Hydrogenispora ethanolica]|uniref:Beta-galactosidase n=1 Tax=Hydrogenispora ethanolica TaxID=1082276 RepID=A0A4R1RA40_HYDET|nr:beta-galactosidase [Hydrogenispora ethanolica]TCL62558.1 beta-galactosidase [Hydrogenispora ethanolica]